MTDAMDDLKCELSKAKERAKRAETLFESAKYLLIFLSNAATQLEDLEPEEMDHFAGMIISARKIAGVERVNEMDPDWVRVVADGGSNDEEERD